MSTELSLEPTAKWAPSGEYFSSWMASFRSFMWTTSVMSLKEKRSLNEELKWTQNDEALHHWGAQYQNWTRWEIWIFYPPDSENGEGAILHPQGQVNAISADGCTADGLLHVTASYQCVIYKTPYPLDTEGSRTNVEAKPWWDYIVKQPQAVMCVVSVL